MAINTINESPTALQSPQAESDAKLENETSDRSVDQGQDNIEHVKMDHQTAMARDKEAYFQKKPSPVEYVFHASKKCKRSPFSLVFEFGKLARGKGQLTLEEYVQYGVYDPGLSPDEKARFITNKLHWPITSNCCDMTWQGVTEDKWLCSHVLERTGIPLPKTLAVIDKTNRSYPDTLKITNATELRDFALSQSGEPFFGKENRGICSWGAFLAVEAEQDRLHLKGEGWIDYEDLMDRFVGSTTYLLQSSQQNHSFFDQYTDSLATIRICILLLDSGVKLPFAVLKIPSRENIADSFWRPGNLACNLDPATGKILDARTKDAFGTQSHTSHPQSDAALVGEIVPEWDRLLELVHNCSPIFAPVAYQSMDIAVTQNGPVLIELNTGGGFDLLQLASGRGFLTDEVSDFLRAHGNKKL